MKKNKREHKQISLQEINDKRAILIEETSKFGLNSQRVLKVSEELDTMIINYMRDRK
ncbi:aspartyl-phosphate phosphatase Spo0E family protein [Ornithinibacillus sp. BX22]|uniref:Aspartyl-phosphate phosphatase Spo0E family protein n=2 Tax=Ornithinibacillus TaxID=484508 RepID=A0A923L7T2_9BACI|nr:MULTISPECIES: aspartyl-phosphate phosphatase Spo0E family protein [Ornithinibacillus]MBC5638053.1 aspartyl-phosphate phosphatase Spo0E family protein [Ornithinibacillus hominis]MBS3681940.1 aspartyl-phosphate phosphatase Spo0E family protein [Ornithinibacillus massiliensis]